MENTCVITWLTEGWVSSLTIRGGQTPPVTLSVFQSNTQGLLHRQEWNMTSKWRTDGGPCNMIWKKDSQTSILNFRKLIQFQIYIMVTSKYLLIQNFWQWIARQWFSEHSTNKEMNLLIFFWLIELSTKKGRKTA